MLFIGNCAGKLHLVTGNHTREQQTIASRAAWGQLSMQNRRLVRSRACELLPSNDGVHQRECRPKPANALGSDLHRRDVTSEKALPKPVIRGTKVRPASNAPTNALKDSRTGRSACQATHLGRGFKLATGSRTAPVAINHARFWRFVGAQGEMRSEPWFCGTRRAGNRPIQQGSRGVGKDGSGRGYRPALFQLSYSRFWPSTPAQPTSAALGNLDSVLFGQLRNGLPQHAGIHPGQLRADRLAIDHGLGEILGRACADIRFSFPWR